MKNLNCIELSQKEKDSYILIDVRESWEIEMCSFPLSFIHVPLQEVAYRFDEIPMDKEVVVACHHGGRSAVATEILNKNGFEAMNLEGGIHAWALLIDKNMRTY